MRNTLCTTPESHLFAKVVAAFPADTAFATRYADLKGDSVTDGKTFDTRAESDNLARRLMAKGERHTRTQITIGELFVVGDI